MSFPIPSCLHALHFFFFSAKRQSLSKVSFKEKKISRRPASRLREKKKNKQNKTWNNNNNKYKLKITIRGSLNQSFSIASVRFQILKTKQQQQQEPKGLKEISRVGGRNYRKKERGSSENKFQHKRRGSKVNWHGLWEKIAVFQGEEER